MPKELKKAFRLIASLFLGGGFIIFVGLSKGREMASSLSRPSGANVWSVSQELIIALTYTTLIIGALLMLLAIVFSTILFNEWLKRNNTKLF